MLQAPRFQGLSQSFGILFFDISAFHIPFPGILFFITRLLFRSYLTTAALYCRHYTLITDGGLEMRSANGVSVTTIRAVAANVRRNRMPASVFSKDDPASREFWASTISSGMLAHALLVPGCWPNSIVRHIFIFALRPIDITFRVVGNDSPSIVSHDRDRLVWERTAEYTRSRVIQTEINVSDRRQMIDLRCEISQWANFLCDGIPYSSVQCTLFQMLFIAIW